MRRRLDVFDKIIVLIAVLGALAALFALEFRPDASKQSPAKKIVFCTRSAVIKPEWFCGNTVLYVNPDGSRVVIGKANQMRSPSNLREYPGN